MHLYCTQISWHYRIFTRNKGTPGKELKLCHLHSSLWPQIFIINRNKGNFLDVSLTLKALTLKILIFLLQLCLLKSLHFFLQKCASSTMVFLLELQVFSLICLLTRGHTLQGNLFKRSRRTQPFYSGGFSKFSPFVHTLRIKI